MAEKIKQPEHDIIAQLGDYRAWLLQLVEGINFGILSTEEKRRFRESIKCYVYDPQNSNCKHSNIKGYSDLQNDRITKP